MTLWRRRVEQELREAAQSLRQHGPLAPLLRLLSNDSLRERVLATAMVNGMSNWRLRPAAAANLGRRTDALSLRQALSRAQSNPQRAEDEHLMRLETDLPRAPHHSRQQRPGISVYSVRSCGKAKHQSPLSSGPAAQVPYWIWAAQTARNTATPTCGNRRRNSNACFTSPSPALAIAVTWP